MGALLRSREKVARSQEAQANRLTQDTEVSGAVRVLVTRLGLDISPGYRGLASDMLR